MKLTSVVALAKALDAFRFYYDHGFTDSDRARALVDAYNACSTGEVDGYEMLLRVRNDRAALPEEARPHFDAAERVIVGLLARRIYEAAHPPVDATLPEVEAVAVEPAPESAEAPCPDGEDCVLKENAPMVAAHAAETDALQVVRDLGAF